MPPTQEAITTKATNMVISFAGVSAVSIPQQRLIGMCICLLRQNDLTEQNLSNLSAENDLSSPDGLCILIHVVSCGFKRMTVLIPKLPTVCYLQRCLSHVGDGKS